jgi:hypothetical protein
VEFESLNGEGRFLVGVRKAMGRMEKISASILELEKMHITMGHDEIPPSAKAKTWWRVGETCLYIYCTNCIAGNIHKQSNTIGIPSVNLPMP